jgi:hypothetical protein
MSDEYYSENYDMEICASNENWDIDCYERSRDMREEFRGIE